MSRIFTYWCVFSLLFILYCILSPSVYIIHSIYYIHSLSILCTTNNTEYIFSTATDTTYEVAAAFKLSSVAVSSHHSLNRLDGSGEEASSVTGNESNETVVKNNVDNTNGHHSRIIIQTDDNQKRSSDHSDNLDQQHQLHTTYNDTNDDTDDNNTVKVSTTIRNVLLLSAINDRHDNHTIIEEPTILTNLEMVQQTVRGHTNNPTVTANNNNNNLQSVIIQNAHSRLMHSPTSPLRYTTIETADTGTIMTLETSPTSPLQYSTLHTIVPNATVNLNNNNNQHYLNNNNGHNYGDWNYGLSLDLRQKPSDDDKDIEKHHHQQHNHMEQHQHYHHHHHHHHNQHTGGNASVVVIAPQSQCHDDQSHHHADLMDEAQTLISATVVAANNNHNHHFGGNGGTGNMDDDGNNGDIHHHATKIAVNDPHQTNISCETDSVMRAGVMYTYGTIGTAQSNHSQQQSNSNGANSTIDEVIADTLKDEMVDGTTSTSHAIHGATPTSTASSNGNDDTNYLQLISHNHHHHTIRSQSSGGDSRSPSGLSQEEYDGGMQTFANLSNAAHTTGQRDTIYSNSSVSDATEHTSIIHPISISYESPLHSTGGAGISTR